MPHKPLTAEQKAKESGLSRQDMKILGYKALPANKTSELSDNIKELRSLYIPYYDVNGKKLTDFFRIRYLEKPKKFGKSVKTFRKYDQPSNTRPYLYLPKNINWKTLSQDTSETIFITEGEFKAACASKHNFPTIGLGGVYAWKSKKNKLDFLPEFKHFDWNDRKVIIVFDSDLQSNNQVKMALYDLCDLLTNFGAHPHIVFLPGSEDEKVGLDDFIVKFGPKSFSKLIEDAEEFTHTKELWRLNSEVILVKSLGMILERETGVLTTHQKFTQVNYADRNYVDYRGDKPKEKNAAKEWLKWPHRSVANNVTYEPGTKGMTVKGDWSMWYGWGCEPSKGDLQPWHDMMTFIFRNDKEARKWFERWLAIQIQQPGVKLHTAVCMWSTTQGTGKSLLSEVIMKIFGKNANTIDWFAIQNPRNDWAEHKQFVVGEEMTGSDKRAVADRIKNLITQDKIIIDQKYVPSYSVDSFINYFFTSNHPNAFYIDAQDRRLFVWEITSEPKQQSFYTNFRKWKNSIGPSALFHYLLNLDLGDFDEKTRAMKTKHHQEMVEYSSSDLEDWVNTLIQAPDSALKHFDGGENKADLYTASQLKEIYEHQRGYENRITAQGMGLALRRLGVPKVNKGVKFGLGSEIVMFYIVRNREHWLKASLKEVKNHYEEHFGSTRKSGKEKKRKF